MILYTIYNKEKGKYLGVPRGEWKIQEVDSPDYVNLYTNKSTAQAIATRIDPTHTCLVLLKWKIEVIAE